MRTGSIGAAEFKGQVRKEYEWFSATASLPLVSISAQAPNQTRAYNLAQGVVTALQSYLTSVAAQQNIPASRQPVIKSVGRFHGPPRHLRPG